MAKNTDSGLKSAQGPDQESGLVQGQDQNLDHGQHIEQFSPQRAKQEILRLRQALNLHNRFYYTDDAPQISDGEYDGMRHMLSQLEALFPQFVSSDSPSRTVGAPPGKGFAKIRHSEPMLSLDNAFTDADVENFVTRIRRFLMLGSENAPLNWVAEPKIDGLSLSLRYEEGNLISAATRGDGHIGENVTANALMVKDIPTQLAGASPDIAEIRGEIYIERQDFRTLNEKLAESGQKLFVNPRNAAAGALRQLDAQITKSRPLRFFAYAFGELSAPIADTQYEMIRRLKGWGFVTNPLTRLTSSADEMIAAYKHFEGLRAEIAYDIDGVVYKLDRLDLQSRLGNVGRSPRWAIAHKFPAQRSFSRLRHIDIQVGRTGALTPVAHLEEVNVGGVMVSRATLHNEDFIKAIGADGAPIRSGKDIRVGDRVEIQRAGDVIPQIVDVDLSQRPSDSTRFEFPTACPICSSPAVRYTDPQSGRTDAVRRCTGGFFCSAQTQERLKHFVSRLAFNIDGIGTKQIDFFYALAPSEGGIHAPADIFTLAKRDEALEVKLHQQPGWGQRSAQNLFQAIEQKRNIALEKFIYALGIRHVGEGIARLIARHFGSWRLLKENFLSAGLAGQGDLRGGASGVEALLAIDGIGATVAAALRDYFENPRENEILEALLAQITILDFHDETRGLDNNDGPIAGKTLVFTGTLQTMSRAEAKVLAERLGAKVVGTISKQTGLVVAGDSAGSKLKKAQALELDIINETEWNDILGAERAGGRLT